jgi:hypothetical protein
VIRATALLLCSLLPASAQFLDHFNGPALQGWTFFTGDGAATMDFRPGDGFASILVDSTKDQRNIWWALVKRNVSPSLDLQRLSQPGHELRLEARIRVSHAPRRVNLHVNTQRTTDFHSLLMEYDIPDTGNWHTISMTTKGFHAGPGDTVNAQLALMDWGLGKYRVDLDYYKVDVVEAATAAPDLGEPLPYRPPIPDPRTFGERLRAVADGMIDLQYPDVNFRRWAALDGPVLAVNATELVILRWDLTGYAGKRAAGPGLLELTTHSLERTPSDLPEFGEVRVTEILGGDPKWDGGTVTLNSLLRGRPLDDVLNTQMIIDVNVAGQRGGKTFATISRPVLQRLLDGKTLGLAIRPLGAIHAAFDPAPTLYFTLR